METRAHPFGPAMLAAANIHPVTGLATDYLNHFNEVAMLVDMAPSMPEVLPDILEWRPRAYVDHFHVTGFREKDLAIAAYEAADRDVVAAFEGSCDAIAEAILDIQNEISGGSPDLDGFPAHAQQLFALISDAGGFIDGGAGAHVPEQADIDALFA